MQQPTQPNVSSETDENGIPKLIKPLPIDKKLKVDNVEVDKLSGDDDSPVKRFDDALKDAKSGRPTKGKTKQFEKEGGFETANKDFDNLNLSDIEVVETEEGIIRTGRLEDGTTFTVRPISSDDKPTLEKIKPNG